MEATTGVPPGSGVVAWPPRHSACTTQHMTPRWVSFAFSAVVLHAVVAAIDPVAVNNPVQGNLADGAQGAGVVRAQILLARAHFSCGEIDGVFGSNFQKALSAFQGERKLPVTGALDAATWSAIHTDTAPALIDYTITPKDLNGPFAPVPAGVEAPAATSRKSCPHSRASGSSRSPEHLTQPPGARSTPIRHRP